MNIQLESRLELFASNTQAIKEDFIWQNTLVKRLAALLYTAENKAVDGGAIRESYELIKKSTGVFSSFRGNSAITIATLLSLSDSKEAQLSNTLTVYGMLKEAKFKSSDYLVLAAYQIAANTGPENYKNTIIRAKDFYDGMKAAHYFFTGRDDTIFAAMLGLSDVDTKTGLARMEQIYSSMKPEFNLRNSLQALTQVLVLGGETSETLTRVLALRDEFRKRGARLDKEYTLSTLGVLALLPADVSSIADDVTGAYGFLRTQKGFGHLSVTKQELLLYSAAVAASKYAEDVKSGILTSAVSTSITNIIIAHQTAVIAAVSASSAAAASSSSS